MSLVPFSKSELEEDWGVKVKDIDNIYFTMYIIIIILICFILLTILTSLIPVY